MSDIRAKALAKHRLDIRRRKEIGTNHFAHDASGALAVLETEPVTGERSRTAAPPIPLKPRCANGALRGVSDRLLCVLVAMLRSGESEPQMLLLNRLPHSGALTMPTDSGTHSASSVPRSSRRKYLALSTPRQPGRRTTNGPNRKAPDSQLGSGVNTTNTSHNSDRAANGRYSTFLSRSVRRRRIQKQRFRLACFPDVVTGIPGRLSDVDDNECNVILLSN